MLSSLTRIFTTRICPTCSKAVHRSKLDAHLRRHNGGLAGYRRLFLRSTTLGDQGAVFTYRRSKDGHWTLLTTRSCTDRQDLVELARERAAVWSAEDAPTFTKRPVPDTVTVGPSSYHVEKTTPAPNTLL